MSIQVGITVGAISIIHGTALTGLPRP
jgi:hypothetical protein